MIEYPKADLELRCKRGMKKLIRLSVRVGSGYFEIREGSLRGMCGVAIR